MRKAIIIFLLFLVARSNRTLSGQTDMSNIWDVNDKATYEYMRFFMNFMPKRKT